MSARQIAVLAAVAALLAAVWFWPRGEAEKSGGEALMALNAGEIDRIDIRNDQWSFYLSRSGSSWQAVDSSVTGPADPEAAAKLIDKLAGMKADRVISRSAGDLARFDLTPELASRVAVTAGLKSAALLIGKYAPGYTYSYVKPETQNVVYLVKAAPIREIGSDAARFRLKRPFIASRDAVKRLELTNDTASWVIAATDAGYTLNGVAADSETVTGLIDSVLALSADRFMPSHGEKRRPLWKITLDADSQPIRAVLYAADDGFDMSVDGRPDLLYLLGWRFTPVTTKLDLLSAAQTY